MRKARFNLVTSIMQYDAGELKGNDVIDLFSHLIKTGRVWTLQGSYGRMAQNLIDRGYLSNKGTILKEA